MLKHESTRSQNVNCRQLSSPSSRCKQAKKLQPQLHLIMRQKFIGQVFFLDSFLTHIEQVYTGRRKVCVWGGVDQTVMSGDFR